MAKDPIARFQRFLLSEDVLTAQRADEIVTEVREAVEEAARFAEAQPVPKPEDGLRHVFAEGAVSLHTS
jgi:TPP-dependent pyruvate/acetoin dehydrogenase alpha subunit